MFQVDKELQSLYSGSAVGPWGFHRWDSVPSFSYGGTPASVGPWFLDMEFHVTESGRRRRNLVLKQGMAWVMGGARVR